MDKKQVRYFIKSRRQILTYEKSKEGDYILGENTFTPNMFEHCGKEISEAEYKQLSRYPQGYLIFSIGSINYFTPEMIDIVSPLKPIKVGIFRITKRK